MIEQAIIGLLLSTPEILAAVGANGVWAVDSDQSSVYPYILVRRISGGSDPTLDNKDVRRVRLQIEAWGATIPTFQALGEIVETTLNGYAGAPLASDGSNPGVIILICQVDNSLDMFDSDSRAWRRILDFKIQFTS